MIAPDLLERAGEMNARIVQITLAVFLPRAPHPLGRIEQAFAIRIVTGPADQGADRLLHIVRHHHAAVGATHQISVHRMIEFAHIALLDVQQALSVSGAIGKIRSARIRRCRPCDP